MADWQNERMTEEQWLVCDDPRRMLRWLRQRLSVRKLRMFGCACCRHTWHLMLDERSRRAVEAAERFADGELSDAELHAAYRAASREVAAVEWGIPWNPTNTGPRMAAWVSWERPDEAANTMVSYVQHGLEDSVRTALLRDAAGNPFRPFVIDPAILAWSRGTVVRLAQVIYEERRWEDVPVLADALEDAGCDDQAMLSHLRGPGPHARGCWAVDLLHPHSL